MCDAVIDPHRRAVVLTSAEEVALNYLYSCATVACPDVIRSGIRLEMRAMLMDRSL